MSNNLAPPPPSHHRLEVTALGMAICQKEYTWKSTLTNSEPNEKHMN